MRLSAHPLLLLLLACWPFAFRCEESCASSNARSQPADAGPPRQWQAVPQAIAEEALERLAALGRVSDREERLQRTFFSPAHRHASSLVSSWLQEAGLTTWTDVVGNVHGRVECAGQCSACGGALVLGSHYDTVLDAGLYDGPLGIIAAIAAVKAHLREIDGLPACPLEVVAFADEEGVRFHSTFLGSRVFAGSLPPSVLQAADGDGVTLEAALLATDGIAGDRAALGLALREAAASKERVRAFVEVHIEQGPVLEAMGVPLVRCLASPRMVCMSNSRPAHAFPTGRCLSHRRPDLSPSQPARRAGACGDGAYEPAARQPGSGSGGGACRRAALPGCVPHAARKAAADVAQGVGSRRIRRGQCALSASSASGQERATSSPGRSTSPSTFARATTECGMVWPRPSQRPRRLHLPSAVVADVAEAVRSIAERRGVGHSIALKARAAVLDLSSPHSLAARGRRAGMLARPALPAGGGCGCCQHSAGAELGSCSSAGEWGGARRHGARPALRRRHGLCALPRRGEPLAARAHGPGWCVPLAQRPSLKRKA